jgi:hypothetical protein
MSKKIGTLSAHVRKADGPALPPRAPSVLSPGCRIPKARWPRLALTPYCITMRHAVSVQPPSIHHATYSYGSRP